MYTAFYGLREKPFALSPDPRYLFLAESHREALAHLLYGIDEGEGFIAVTGEVGTGKTTLCRTLLQRLGSATEVAFLFNPSLSRLELMQAVNAELALPVAGRSLRDLHAQLNDFLLERKRAGRRVLLLVDEAQNLEPETLEQVRLLSNLETETQKLLQIVLIGQPELDAKLASPELRQLRQRISVYWHLGPLSAAETRDYVRHRLRIAAGAGREIFTGPALRAIHTRSGGIPRLVNVLCDRALLAGYAERSPVVGPELVRRADRELRGPKVGSGAPGRWRRLGLLVPGRGLSRSLSSNPGSAPGSGPGAGSTGGPAAVPGEGRRGRAGAGEERADSGRQGLARRGSSWTPWAAAAAVVLAAGLAGTFLWQRWEPGGRGSIPAETADTAEPGSTGSPAAATSSEPPPAASEEAGAGSPEPLAPAAVPHPAPGSSLAPAAGGPPPLAAASGTASGTAQKSASPVAPSFAAWVGALPAGARGLDRALAVLGADRPGARVFASDSAGTALLLALNRPAALALEGGDGVLRHAVLRELGPDRAVLVDPGSGEERAADLAALVRQWSGQTHVVWQDFEGLPHAVSLGDAGPPVAWLQRALAGLGLYAGPASGRFDWRTYEGVLAFQRARRLAADGVVGPVTKMALYDALDYPVHRLVSAERPAEDAEDGRG